MRTSVYQSFDRALLPLLAHAHGVAPFLDPNQSISLLLQCRLVDARAGGIVVGRSHAEGNIYLYEPEVEGRVFRGLRWRGHMEGGEYVVNHASYHKHRQRIDEINAERHGDGPHPPLLIVPSIRVLNTHRVEQDRYLLFDERGQFIVNAGATAAHLGELQLLNEDGRDY